MYYNFPNPDKNGESCKSTLQCKDAFVIPKEALIKIDRMKIINIDTIRTDKP